MKARIGLAVAAVLVALGAGAYTVVSPDAAKPYEKTAADELSAYLKRVVPFGNLTVDGHADVVFHVGDTAFAAAKGLAAAQLDEDRWVVRSFGRNVILTGGGSRGTLYAVSHFLEDFCDVRWWSDAEENAPAHDALDLGALDLTGKPAFAYRSIHRSRNVKEADPRLAIRRRLNSNGLAGIPAAWGGDLGYGLPDHAHTFDMYLPWSVYGKDHPERYSLQNGKRIGGQVAGQLCLSNPELKGVFLEKLEEKIAQSEKLAAEKGLPPPRMYEISMNDNVYPCTCEACQVDYAKWNRSGQYLKFVNEIAQEARKRHPDILVTMLAYYFTEEPPKGGIVAADNVIVKLTDTKSNAAASILQEDNGVFRRMLEGWKGKFSRLYVWDYAITFDGRTKGFPFASEFHYADTYRHYLASGVTGIFWEHEDPLTSDLWEIKFYLESRFFEDPYLDEAMLIKDVFARYFDAASKSVYEARRIVERARVRENGFVDWRSEFTFLKEPDIREMVAKWDEAERLVAGNETLLRRVRRARSGTDRLVKYRERIPPRRADGTYVADTRHLDIQYVGKAGKIVDDPESPNGKAVVYTVGADPHGHLSLPFAVGVYDNSARKTVASRNFASIDTTPGYHWYTVENVTIPKDPSLFFTRSWVIQATCAFPELIGRTFDLRTCAKFEGPKYVPGSTGPSRFYIAGYELVPKE